MLLENLPKDKHYRYFEAAHVAAFFCSGVGYNRNAFRLGACLVSKKQILSVKTNSSKTHPLLLRFTKFPFLHSESSAIISAGLDNCDDAILYVLRIKRDKTIALAKPCNYCMKLIQHVGIKKIYFTTSLGYEELVL